MKFADEEIPRHLSSFDFSHYNNQGGKRMKEYVVIVDGEAPDKLTKGP